MSADDILKILDSISKYVIYFYPGYLTIYVYYFLKAKTLKDGKSVVWKAIAISFLYKLCLDKLPVSSELSYHFWMILVSVIVPYFAYLLQKSETIIDVFDFLDISTRFEDNEIDILDNGEMSAWVRVYIQDENIVYEGFLGDKELESGKRQFISLKKYRKYMLDDNGKPKEPYIENHNTDDDVVVIFYDKIKIIEKNKIESDNNEE